MAWVDLMILPLAISLGIDAFSVALSAGVFPTDDERRRTFRLVFHFGLFQGGMTLLGWLGGQTLESLISAFDHWIALALLAYVGGRMIHSSSQRDTGTVWQGEENSCRQDPSRGAMLLLMSVGTSIDALAVGLSLALAGSQVLLPSLVIGLVAAAMTYVGLNIGCRLGMMFGRPVEFVGGLVLIAIGVQVVVSHLGLV